MPGATSAYSSPAEVGLPDPGGHDQVVVPELELIAADPLGDDPASRDIEVDDLGHHAGDVLVLLSNSRSGAAIFPSDMIPVAHWYSSGANT